MRHEVEVGLSPRVLGEWANHLEGINQSGMLEIEIMKLLSNDTI